MAGRETKTGLGGGQAALAVIVVAGIGVAALVLRPGGGAFPRGRGPLGNSAIAVGIAVVWAIAAFAAAQRHRRRFSRYLEHRTAAEQRVADVVRLLLVLGPIAVPVLLLALHRFHPGAAETDHPGRPRPNPPVGIIVPSTMPAGRPSHGGWTVPGWLPRSLLGLLIAVAVAALAYAVGYLLRLLYRAEPDGYAGAYGAMDDEEELLAQAVDSGRRALLDGDDARAAVIACYAAMETSLAASGVARLASDSPQDLLERAAAGDLLTGSAATVLTDLFREARYSTHPMDDGHRRRASDALTEIAAQLERRASAAEGAA